MNFFNHQSTAKKKTLWLYFLFILGLSVWLIPIYILTTLFIYCVSIAIDPMAAHQLLWGWESFFITSMVSILIILTGSLYRIKKIQEEGGLSLARMLGGKQLRKSKNPLERQLLNVVEEMAIASGVLMPAVFIIEQQGINAFAAGYEAEDTAISITRGAIEMLNRDELQAVIAHEFSHILHGDTHINMKIMGLLYGITMISDFSVWFISGAWIPRGIKKSIFLKRYFVPSVRWLSIFGLMVLQISFFNHIMIVFRISLFFIGLSFIGLLFFALMLFLIGLTGLVIGDFIKSAISRQREYLADASAVQFTRNPEAIVNALKVIGGYQSGSIIRSRHIQQVSHLFFGEALRTWWESNWWATHPPLISRIQRLDPSFRGAVKEIDEKTIRLWNKNHAISLFSAPPKQHDVALKVNEVMDHIGSPDLDSLSFAQELLSQVPDYLHQNVSDLKTAKALVYVILLHPDKMISSTQMKIIQEQEESSILSEVMMILGIFPNISAKFRLPLLDIVSPHLLQLEVTERKPFLTLIKTLVLADQCVHIFEYLLLEHFLQSFSAQGARSKEKPHKLKDLEKDIALLLSVVSQLGKAEQSQQKYTGAMQRLFPQTEYVNIEAVDIHRMDKLKLVFKRLNSCDPNEKKTLLTLVVHCVLSDGIVSVEEVEVVRLVSIMLSCPMPILSVGRF